MSNFGPKTYSNNPNFDFSAARVTDAEMDLIMDNTIVPCVDIMLVDRESGTSYFPLRTAKPAEGLWFIGGRIPRSAESIEMAAKSVLERETGTTIDTNKLSFVACNMFRWDYRKFDLNNKGRVDFNTCYAYEATDQELKTIDSRLTPDEYDTNHGLKAYSRDDLIDALASEAAIKSCLVNYHDIVHGTSF